MTPLMLQDMLVEEMKLILDGYLYKNPLGDRVPMQVFAQHIPIRETDDDEYPVPFIVVRLDGGADPGGESNNVVDIMIIVEVWDDNLDSQGYKDTMNVIQKIYQRFHENPNLNNRAVHSGAFEWALQENEGYPYFVGACTMSFYIPAIRREDKYS
jgi:hypothetical protein